MLTPFRVIPHEAHELVKGFGSVRRQSCGLGLAKGWSAEKLEVLVTRYVSKLLKAKLTTLARNVNDVA